MIRIRQVLKELYKKHDRPFINFTSKIYGTYRKSNFINFRHYDWQHRKIAEELNKELDKVLNFHLDFELECYIQKFAKRFAQLCKTKFASGLSSGTAALQLSLIALGIRKGDEVVTAPNSYIATALAISNTGAKPVFVDADKQTFNIDANKIEEAITKNTKAIMPVHLYGQMADMNSIIKLAKKYNLFIIEDACQAFGAEYQNKKAGSLGYVGCFSFSTSKNLSGLGNGGIVVSNNKSFINNVKILRNPESNAAKLRLSNRTPCYLDAIQVAFLNAKLKYVNKWIQLRREKAKFYNELLQNTGVMLPKEKKDRKHAYYSYVIRLKERDKLKRFLEKKRIETSIEYPLPIHMTKTFEYLGYKKGDFPIIEKLNKEILSLPISPFLKNEKIEEIVTKIKEFSKK